jgi:hypothetical protein
MTPVAGLAGLVLVIGAVVDRGAARAAPAARQAAAQQGDLAGRSVVRNAIARRRAVLSGVHHYRYEAFVKLAARDLGEPQDSARCVLLLSEARSSAYWERPDRYQETIEARHRSADPGIGRQLVLVDEITHFARSRIDFNDGGDASGRSAVRRNRVAPNRYSIVSPIADDALDYYDYVVSDTLIVDGRRVFRIALRPRSDAAPLFTGTLDIADSTYDVRAMDLGVNAAVRLSTVSALRYQERWSDVGQGRWMPTEIHLTGELRPKLSARWLPRTVAGLALPEFPKQVSFEQVASLAAFSFDDGFRPAGVPEYRAVVGDRADRPDSATWSAPGAVPLTTAERAAWVRADSLERHPALLARLGRDADAVQRVAMGPGFFHYNRVDGAYLGAVHDWHVGSALLVPSKLGYAMGSETWQYRAGVRAVLSSSRRISAGASYHDETVAWPALVPGGYDPTASALVARIDPSEYYRERGFTLSLGAKLLDFTRLELRYDDVRQSSQNTVAGWGGLRGQSDQQFALPNPPIHDGHLRAVLGILTYDSRQLLRSRGVDYWLSGGSWTRITVGAEVAEPSFIADDFSYRRYAFELERRQEMGWLGSTTLSAAGGVATRSAPPQRYFTVGFGTRVLAAEGTGFNTLARTGYAGNRALMLSVRHDFGRQFFVRSGLPLLHSLPVALSLRGGVFWADLSGNTPSPADTLLTSARTPYAEWGFTLGNLTPFLSPVDLAVSFTWQISSYPTHPFRLGVGITGP